MDQRNRFGVFLPSFVWKDDGPERAEGIANFARTVEDLGFDSVFITDHLLAAKHFYSVSWLEPVSTLSYVAAVTKRVRLGTSVMVLPTRNPVVLAKELATLQYLSNNRVILGGGVGWYPPEFEAVGTKKAERGRRADELLDILIPLLEGKTVTYEGRYYNVDEVFIEPSPSRRPEIWIGGGSQLADSKSPDLPRFVDAVKARVLKGEGWIPRPTCPPEEIGRDWSELQSYLSANGRDPSTFTVAHENFLHLVMSNDSQKAREEQHRAFLNVMSGERGSEYLEKVYLFGTPDEIVARLQERIDAGAGYFMLHTLTPDPRQLEMWIKEIVPNVVFP